MSRIAICSLALISAGCVHPFEQKMMLLSNPGHVCLAIGQHFSFEMDPDENGTTYVYRGKVVAMDKDAVTITGVTKAPRMIRGTQIPLGSNVLRIPVWGDGLNGGVTLDRSRIYLIDGLPANPERRSQWFEEGRD